MLEQDARSKNRSIRPLAPHVSNANLRSLFRLRELAASQQERRPTDDRNARSIVIELGNRKNLCSKVKFGYGTPPTRDNACHINKL